MPSAWKIGLLFWRVACQIASSNQIPHFRPLGPCQNLTGKKTSYHLRQMVSTWSRPARSRSSSFSSLGTIVPVLPLCAIIAFFMVPPLLQVFLKRWKHILNVFQLVILIFSTKLKKKNYGNLFHFCTENLEEQFKNIMYVRSFSQCVAKCTTRSCVINCAPYPHSVQPTGFPNLRQSIPQSNIFREWSSHFSLLIAT